MSVIRLHKHEEYPLFVAHVKDGTKPISPGNPAHVFGPYASFEDAVAADTPDDGCYKVALEWVNGPQLSPVTDRHTVSRE